MNPRTNPVSRLVLLLSTGFGAGYSPVMPGTVGALWGIPLAWLVYSTPVLAVQLLLLLVLVGVGVPLCHRAARELGNKDPSAVVWDEFSTIPFVFFLVGSQALKNPWVWGTGFLLHRLFDITKPPPVNRLEALPGGWGIMADDCAAGVYACLTLHILIAFGLLGG